MAVLLVFLDGVGLGPDDPQVNPFLHAQLPCLSHLLDGRPPLRNGGVLATRWATLVPTDATLGVEGMPQSGTGQTTLFTGINAARAIGQHYGPYPNRPLRSLLSRHGLFGRLVKAGCRVAFANAYPHRYLDRLARGKGRLSATTFAARAGGIRLRNYEDLRQGRALSAFLTNEGWRDVLGYSDVPVISPYEAGCRLAHLAKEYDFTAFEHYATDIAGHRGSREEIIALLEKLDVFLAGILDTLDLDRDLLLVTSDHGNLEDWTTKKHTLNPVPTLLVGHQREQIAARIRDLTDIAPTILAYLGVDAETAPGRSSGG